MQKILLNTLIVCFFGIIGNAQTKIKDGTVIGSSSLPDSNAILDLESANKGLLLPRIALTATDQPAPLTAHTAGMTVYNTATAGSGATAVTPGYYYNDGTQWVRVGGVAAYKEPWNIQNTTTPADSNTQDIYQMGKVAINKDSADRQLDINGNFRSTYHSADGNYYSIQSGKLGDGSLIPTDNISLFVTPDSTDVPFASDKYSMLYMDTSQVGVLLKASPTNLSGLTLNNGGQANLSAYTPADGASSLNLNNVVSLKAMYPNFATASELHMGDHIQFLHTDTTTGMGIGYTFPNDGGAANQVLVSDGTPYISTLHWKSIDSLTSEPWNVQGTATPADSNTQNIYQQGKVAVGFTSADTVSGAQIEVKGDLKADYDGGDFHSGITTNASGYGMPVNISYIADSADLNAASKLSTVFLTQDFANIQSSRATGEGGSIGTFSNNGGAVGLNANNVGGDENSSIWINSTPSFTNITLGSYKSGGERTEVNIDKLQGVSFDFSDSTNTPEGNYSFPRNNGTANQVLTTDGAAGAAQLKWESIDSLTSEPWYSTTTNTGATHNTDSVYSMGKVGIGYTNPAYNLDIADFLNNGAYLSLGQTGTNTNGQAAVNLFSKRTSANSITNATSRGWKMFVLSEAYSSGAANSGGLYFEHWLDGNRHTNNLVLDTTGKVGIGIAKPNSTLQVNGSLSLPIKSVSANYTVTDADYKILVRSTGASDVTLTLPDPATCAGRIYVIQNMNAAGGGVEFNYNIETGVGVVINVGAQACMQAGGSASYNSGTAITLQSDGTSWTGITQ